MITRFKHWLISVHERIPSWIESLDEFIEELRSESNAQN